MGSIELRTLSNASALVAAAHETDEPVIVYDGEDECLVVMRPAVFERIYQHCIFKSRCKQRMLYSVVVIDGERCRLCRLAFLKLGLCRE